MTHYEIRQVMEQHAKWLLFVPGVLGTGMSRNPDGEKFAGVLMEWKLQIVHTDELSDEAKEMIRKNLPSVPIDWLWSPRL